jgi:hypothetical protein
MGPTKNTNTNRRFSIEKLEDARHFKKKSSTNRMMMMILIIKNSSILTMTRITSKNEIVLERMTTTMMMMMVTLWLWFCTQTIKPSASRRVVESEDEEVGYVGHSTISKKLSASVSGSGC